MAPIVWVFITAIILLIQPKLALFDCPLNLTLALVYVFGMRTTAYHPAASGSDDVTPEIRSTLFGAGIGLIEDAMIGSLMGPNLLSKGLVGLMSSIVYRDIFFQWESVLGGVVLTVLTLLDGIIVIAARQLFSNMAIGGSAAVELIIIQAIMNIPLGLVLKPGQNIATSRRSWIRGKRYN
jgi:cell shape-determining protein MreD